MNILSTRNIRRFSQGAFLLLFLSSSSRPSPRGMMSLATRPALPRFRSLILITTLLSAHAVAKPSCIPRCHCPLRCCWAGFLRMGLPAGHAEQPRRFPEKRTNYGRFAGLASGEVLYPVRHAPLPPCSPFSPSHHGPYLAAHQIVLPEHLSSVQLRVRSGIRHGLCGQPRGIAAGIRAGLYGHQEEHACPSISPTTTRASSSVFCS